MRALRSRVLALLVVGLLGVTGCDDAAPSAPTQTSGPESTPEFNNVDTKLLQSDEGQAAVRLAELMARSLQDAEVREKVRSAMRRSPYREHKLQFGEHLRSDDGATLLAAMASSPEVEPREVLSLLQEVRPMEMYFPVDEHRENWTGGPDVVVATLLDDQTVPAGFRTSGEPFRFESAHEAPDIPVLAIVPQETDFDDPIDRAQFENVDEAGGKAIGSYERSVDQTGVDSEASACDSPYAIKDCTSGGGGGGVDWGNLPSGLYMTKVWIPDDHEGFAKGDPEFETHLQAPMEDPSVAEDLWCAAESDATSTFSFYNQDEPTFEGTVLLADSATLENFVAQHGTGDIGMSVISWEDDDTRCEIKADEDRLRNMIEAVAAAYDPVSSVISGVSVGGIVTALPVAVNAAIAVANWLKSNDDVVGTRIEQACSFPDGTTGNFEIKDGTTSEGCSQLKWHNQADYQ